MILWSTPATSPLLFSFPYHVQIRVVDPGPTSCSWLHRARSPVCVPYIYVAVIGLNFIIFLKPSSRFIIINASLRGLLIEDSMGMEGIWSGCQILKMNLKKVKYILFSKLRPKPKSPHTTFPLPQTKVKICRKLTGYAVHGKASRESFWHLHADLPPLMQVVNEKSERTSLAPYLPPSLGSQDIYCCLSYVELLSYCQQGNGEFLPLMLCCSHYNIATLDLCMYHSCWNQCFPLVPEKHHNSEIAYLPLLREWHSQAKKSFSFLTHDLNHSSVCSYCTPLHWNKQKALRSVLLKSIPVFW